jgi:hypothetical protein
MKSDAGDVGDSGLHYQLLRARARGIIWKVRHDRHQRHRTPLSSWRPWAADFGLSQLPPRETQDGRA